MNTQRNTYEIELQKMWRLSGADTQFPMTRDDMRFNALSVAEHVAASPRRIELFEQVDRLARDARIRREASVWRDAFNLLAA